MGEYINDFKTLDEMREYIKGAFIRKLNSKGAEGIIYQIGFSEIVKIYQEGHVEDYKTGMYLMESDMDLDSFIFPRELLICNGKVYGYIAEYFPGDVFDVFERPEEPKLTNVLEARKIFINDALVLTNKGYKLVDLPDNLLFNNEVFKAVDTTSYIKCDDANLKEQNLRLIDAAILGGIDPFVDYRNMVEIDFDKQFEKIKAMNMRG